MSERDINNREWELRNLDRIGRTVPVEERSERIAYEQIRSDYQHLQVANNELRQAILPADSVTADNFRSLTRATEEINRRASRLRTNLQLPRLDRQDRLEINADISSLEQLRASVAALDELIVSFIDSPIFRNPGVLDATSAVRARRDLEAVIELSKRIKRGAERLRN